MRNHLLQSARAQDDGDGRTKTKIYSEGVWCVNGERLAIDIDISM